MSIRNLYAALFASALLSPALGQTSSYPGSEAGYIEPPPQVGAPAKPTPGAAQPRGCSPGVARHDHLTERNIPRPAVRSGACDMHEKVADKTPRKPLHDHARFHKNQ